MVRFVRGHMHTTETEVIGVLRRLVPIGACQFGRQQSGGV